MAGPAFRAAAVRVRVPATSANLGPGYDALGLALGLYDDVVVRVADSGLHVDIAGEGAETLPRDEDHLLVRSLSHRLRPARRAAARAWRSSAPTAFRTGGASVPPPRRSARESLPPARSPRAARPGWTTRPCWNWPTEIEGHPDNVAACLLGGFTLAWMDAGAGDARSGWSLRSPSCRCVFVPAKPLLTETARGLLPRHVPHVDAAFNAGRAGTARGGADQASRTAASRHGGPAAPGVPGPRDEGKRGIGEPTAGRRRPSSCFGCGPHGARAARGERRRRQGLPPRRESSWTANRLSLDDAGASVLPLKADGAARDAPQ